MNSKSYLHFMLNITFLTICISFLAMEISIAINLSDYVDDNFIVNALPKSILFLTAVILAPLYETFLLQLIIIEIIIAFNLKKVSFTYIISILLSGLGFAITHNFNLFYFIQTLLIGFILALTYVHIRLYYSKKTSIAFVSVAIIHSFNNLFVFIFNEYLAT